RVRPPRDIDVLFALPYAVYHRYEGKTGNKQSQLLQEVKNVLAQCYTVTKMRGDGQVVVIPFATQSVELVPAFSLTDGKYWVCDTKPKARSLMLGGSGGISLEMTFLSSYKNHDLKKCRAGFGVQKAARKLPIYLDRSLYLAAPHAYSKSSTPYCPPYLGLAGR